MQGGPMTTPENGGWGPSTPAPRYGHYAGPTPPQDGQPASGEPASGEPAAPQAPHGQPQYGQPQYGQPQDGQPQYGQPQYGQPQYGQPSGQLDPTQERFWASGSHWGALVVGFVSSGFLAWLVPMVVMMVKGKESAFVRREAVESLNFQISMLIYAAVSGVLLLVLVGFVLLPI